MSEKEKVVECEFSPMERPEQGTLRLGKFPGKGHDIGLFIIKNDLMFPLATFADEHAARRFVSWMTGAPEPKPTMDQEYKLIMSRLIQRAEQAKGFEAVIGEPDPTRDKSDLVVTLGGKLEEDFQVFVPTDPGKWHKRWLNTVRRALNEGVQDE